MTGPTGPTPATPTLDAVLTAGNTAVNTITLQDATTPLTLFSQMSDTGFVATDATGIPQYDVNISAGGISVTNSNGDNNILTSGGTSITSGSKSANFVPTTVTFDDITVGTSSAYQGDGIFITNLTSNLGYKIANNMPPSGGEGFARLDLTSGDLTTTTPRALLQAYVDSNASPSYAPNINLLDLGGANGEELLLSNGNSDGGLGLAYNTIQLFSDSVVNNSFIQLKTIDASTSAGSTLYLGQSSFSLSTTNQTAFSIASGFTDPVVFRRNISTTTNTGQGYPVGMLENSVINATTTGTTTLTVSNAFATIVNTPTDGTRIFVLPTPTLGSVGYWYAICNKSTSFTIAVHYPALTTIATIPVSPSATNGGSVGRFAVDSIGNSYFTTGDVAVANNATPAKLTAYNQMLIPYGYLWASFDATSVGTIGTFNTTANTTYIRNYYLPQGLVITNFGIWFNSTNATAITGSNFGIYSYSGVSPALLASTGALPASIPTANVSFALSAPYTIPTSGMYGIAYNFVNASIVVRSTPTGAGNANLFLTATANRIDNYAIGSVTSVGLSANFAGTLTSTSNNIVTFFT
jgi:hypothetical protein